jgi:hypothetical protein
MSAHFSALQHMSHLLHPCPRFHSAFHSATHLGCRFSFVEVGLLWPASGQLLRSWGHSAGDALVTPEAFGMVTLFAKKMLNLLLNSA